MIILHLYCICYRLCSALAKREVLMCFGDADSCFCESAHGFPIKILFVALGERTLVHLPLFRGKNEILGP